MKVILASSNNGKIKEFKEILARFNIEVLSLKDINFTQEIIEDGNSFYENALIKAKTIYDLYHIPVIADDSGLCVDYLNGEPGIYSARYGGLSDEADRIKLILKKMEGVLERGAHFHCSIVFYISNNLYKHFAGEVYGKLDYTEKGGNGFGYDVIFIPNGYNETFGELASSIKNEISHRALAIKSFIKYLENDFSN